MEFQTKLELGGKTATGMEVPASVVEGLGAGKRPAVSVAFNGYTYRSTVASMDGRYMLPVSAEVRAATGATAGDTLQVTVELDTAPREVEVPTDFAAVLASTPIAKAFFESLSYSNQRAHVMAIEGAKTAETRQRRIEKAVEALRAGKK
jgi:hypothetical protein